MILKAILAFCAGWFSWRLFKTFTGYRSYLYYKRQGITFTGASWSFTRDMRTLMRTIKENPTAFSWLEFFRLSFGDS